MTPYRDDTESRIAAATAESIRARRDLEQIKAELKEERFQNKFNRIFSVVFGSMFGFIVGLNFGIGFGYLDVTGFWKQSIDIICYKWHCHENVNEGTK